MSDKPSFEAPYWVALLGDQSPLRRQVAKHVLRQWCLDQGQPASQLFGLPAEELARCLTIAQSEAVKLLECERLIPQATQMLKELAAHDTGVLTRLDVAYPETLAERLPEEQLPYLLYYRGNLSLLTQPAIAILGASNPTSEAIAVTTNLARALAHDGYHMVGGYAPGLDRAALKTAQEAGGWTTLLLPGGIMQFARIMTTFQAALDSEQMLMISPFAPDAPASPQLATARLRLIAALAEAMVMISPDAGPEALFVSGGAGPCSPFLWAGSEGPSVEAWQVMGATIFQQPEEARERLTEMFGLAPRLLENNAASIDDLAGVEPIAFRDADSAIETLGRTGKVPSVLAHRLREANYPKYPGDEDP